MNLNKFKTPYTFWKEEIVSNSFALSVGQYFGVRTLQGKNNKDLKFQFKIHAPLSSKDTMRLGLNFNLFTVSSQSSTNIVYQCRIDSKDGIYNFKIEFDYDTTIPLDWALLNSITSSTDPSEEYINVPQTDFTNPIFVSDNCYNPETDEDYEHSTPIPQNGAVEITFSKDVFIHNRHGIQIYFGGTNDPNYAIVGNGSSMVSPDAEDHDHVINNDSNGARILPHGATAIDVDGRRPNAGDTVKSSNYLVDTVPSVTDAVLTISPSTGVFRKGKYIVYVSSDAITDLAGNFFNGKTNMFIVA